MADASGSRENQPLVYSDSDGDSDSSSDSDNVSVHFKGGIHTVVWFKYTHIEVLFVENRVLGAVASL